VRCVKNALETASPRYKTILDELASVTDDAIDLWLWSWCARHPRFFLECFTKIPIPRYGPSDWTFRRPQQAYFDATHQWINDRIGYRKTVRRNIVLKARQHGGTTEEIGEIYHDMCFIGLSYVGKIITFEDDTAAKLKKILDTMHAGAIATFTELGFSPYYFLPFVPYRKDDSTFGNKHDFECDDTGSTIEFTTEGGKGSGRSLTVNRMYWTEYQKWQRTADAKSGFLGSMVQDGTATHTIDGTGNGIGNALYAEYQAAKAGESAYMAHFYGLDSFGYDPEFLAEQRSALGDDLFQQEYPATDEDAFVRDDNARFKTRDIFACAERDEVTGVCGAQYMCDVDPFKSDPSRLFGEVFSHGCDPADVTPTGSKTAISTRHVKSGMLACEPFNEFASPRECAFELRRRFERFPGLIVVEENNHGHAVIMKCLDLSVRKGPFAGEPLRRYMYKHPKPGRDFADCKYGWPENKDTKVQLACDYEERLEQRAINMPCEELRKQAREFCRRPDGSLGRPKQGERREGKQETYDDLIMADMMAIQGYEQALRRVRKDRNNVGAGLAGMTTSMRKD